MPIAVDHAQRRAEVTAAAMDLVAEGGLAAVTFRAIADRLGFSTTVVSHYFKDRSRLMASVYAATIAEASALREAAFAAAEPVEALEALLPLGESQRRFWRIWLCIWTSALFDPALLEEHRSGLAGTRRRMFESLVARGLDPAPAESAAEDVVQSLFGIAMQALFDEAGWPPERQCAGYRRNVARTLAAHGLAAPARAARNAG